MELVPSRRSSSRDSPVAATRNNNNNNTTTVPYHEFCDEEVDAKEMEEDEDEETRRGRGGGGGAVEDVLDPPRSWWWSQYLWPGLGLFGESYLLFSLGTLTPVWQRLYPDCYDTITSTENEDNYNSSRNRSSTARYCSASLIPALTYGVVLGVIVGMVVIGCWATTLGRRHGSILTATLMLLGSTSLFVLALTATASDTTTNVQSLFQGIVVSFVVFGIGVGGEYPLAAALASETAHHHHTPQQQQQQQQQPPESALGRGRRVQLVFANQGLGIWCQSVTMVVMLIFFTIQNNNNTNRNNNNNDGDNNNDDDNDKNADSNPAEYTTEQLLRVWRITYGLGAAILGFVWLSRILYLQESSRWLQSQSVAKTATKNRSTYPRQESTLHGTDTLAAAIVAPATTSTKDDRISSSAAAAGTTARIVLSSWTKVRLVHAQYGMRLVGAGLAWCLWDISFYGNKLFQATFLLAVLGHDATLLQLTGAALLNATVALAGYYTAAYLIALPHAWCSRRTLLQSVGFGLTGTVFVVCGLLIASAGEGEEDADESKTSRRTRWLFSLYCVSTFVGQVGPNCTTFVIPAEIFPTEPRTYCHGVCAACGKIGAVLATVVFQSFQHPATNTENDATANSSSSSSSIFYVCGYTSYLACLITILLIPESKTLDLVELDKQWNSILLRQQQLQQQTHHKHNTYNHNNPERNTLSAVPTATEERREHQSQQQQPIMVYEGPANHWEHLSLYERWRMRKKPEGTNRTR